MGHPNPGLARQGLEPRTGKVVECRLRAQVMLTANETANEAAPLPSHLRLVNGSRGVVVAFVTRGEFFGGLGALVDRLKQRRRQQQQPPPSPSSSSSSPSSSSSRPNMDDEEVNEAPQALSEVRLSPDVRQSPRKAITEEGVLERPSPHGRTHHGGDAEMAEATPPPPHGDGRADGNGGGGGGADSSSANSPLTPEQKRRMATNRERAMEIRKARMMLAVE